MALPPTYQNYRTYFTDCIDFLTNYQWIYNYPNTHILVKKVFQQIPTEWIAYFKEMRHEDLNDLALGKYNDTIPSSLNTFIQLVNKLKPVYLYVKPNTDISFRHNTKLNKKKEHEITVFAPMIHEGCKSRGIQYIFDVGAGVGNLSQILHAHYDYKVFGIEGNPDFVQTAIKKQNEEYPHSKNSVKYINHFLTNADSNLKDLINQFLESFKEFNVQKDKVCIIGLHTCGDLGVFLLNVFNNIEFASNLVVMPCCYHRFSIKHIHGDHESFNYFPIGECLKTVCNNREDSLETIFKTPFLRLACQQTSAVWESMTQDMHTIHATNCLFRNILQEVIELDSDVRIVRNKRKTGSKKIEFTIEEFATNLEYSYSFYDAKNPISQEKLKAIKDKIILYYKRDYCGSENTIEALTALQTLLQSVHENIVLLDRVDYLKSFGVSCNTSKITDDLISPRCLALSAWKI